MSYKIVGDSCMELDDALRETGHVVNVPLKLHIGDETIIDDETFDQESFLKKMKAYPESPKSSCPSPEVFEQAYVGADEVYVVTISSELSGTYNSAMLAKRDFEEKNPGVKVAVFDSRSASCGEFLIGKKIEELKQAGHSFEEVVTMTEEYRDSMKTKFVLESLENLRKNGRLTAVTALICDVLSIKPIMRATKEGNIDKEGQARGMKTALIKMAAGVCADAIHTKERILAISHCNNRKRAEFVKEQIAKLITFKDIIILEQRGLSSLYANDGGIIVSY